MNENGTLTLLLQKWTWKMIIIHPFGSVPGGKNTFFLNLLSRAFTVAHFSHHFSFPFVCFSAKYMKMSQK